MAFFLAHYPKNYIIICVMNYSTLTPELSALCRSAMIEEEPFELQEQPTFGTTFEEEKILAEEEYALMLAQYVFGP